MNPFSVHRQTLASLRNQVAKYLFEINRNRTFGSLFLIWVMLTNNCLNGMDSDAKTKKVVESNVAIVCPFEYQAGLKYWIQYRKSQGFVIHLITEPEPVSSLVGNHQNEIQLQPQTSPQNIRLKIRELNDRIPLSAIILVGDGFPTEKTLFGWRDVIPAARVPAKIIQKFGDENDIASDSWFADLDDDGFPDIPIGRLPVQSNQELIELTQRIIDYESNVPSGNWQRRINLIAGLGGFSPIVDQVIESTVRALFNELLSNDFELTLTQANWKGAYCPNPLKFRQTTINRMNEGALFWLYLGHGFHQGLDRFETPQGYMDIFRFQDIESVHCDFPPILLFCACYTGAFDASEDSLAERIMIGPKAPIAVLAASRTSMPYGMSIFGAELLQEISQNSFPFENNSVLLSDSGKKYLSSQEIRLGQLVFNAKKRMIKKIKEMSDDSKERGKVQSKMSNEVSKQSLADHVLNKQEKSDHLNHLTEISEKLQKQQTSSILEKIDALAKVFDPNPKQLDDQLEDHIHLFNLFGDPLLRIRFPQQIQIDAPEIAYAAHSITISGKIEPIKKNNFDVSVEQYSEKAAENKSENLLEKSFEKNENEQNVSSKVLIELVLPRTRSPIPKPRRKTFELTAEEINNYETVYAAANQPVIKSLTTNLNDCCFSTEFLIPEGISGRYFLRVLIEGVPDIYVGSKELTIRPFDSTAVRPSAFYEDQK
ncbi:MAG: C25 family cysteine peptidase [Planctomycetia bacterium]|nr:C25 family cysteine peptidase [Planctomycetia bacterium]